MNVFDVPVRLIDGTATTMSAWAGHCLMVVNTASRCGYTAQYETLEELYEEYAERGFFVIGAPCNQFGGQEPGGAEEITEFCSTTFGVKFPLLEKMDVNGEHEHPLFTALKAGGEDVKWNFEKFIVAPSGEVVARFPSATEPDDMDVINVLEEYLPV